MTKEIYFESCTAMGIEPQEEEIPVEFEDLYQDIQSALMVYNYLKDDWDTMNGNYMGKSYVGIVDIFNILQVPSDEFKLMFDLVVKIDTVRIKLIQDSKPKNSKKPA